MAVSFEYGKTLLSKIVGNVQNDGACYIGLCTAEPEQLSESAFVSHELTSSAQGYARQILGDPQGTKKMDAFSFDADTGKTTVTNGELTIFFPEAESNWGTVSHFILSKTATSEPILWGPLVNAQGTPTPITISQGEVAIFKTEQLKLSI